MFTLWFDLTLYFSVSMIVVDILRSSTAFEPPPPTRIAPPSHGQVAHSLSAPSTLVLVTHIPPIPPLPLLVSDVSLWRSGLFSLKLPKHSGCVGTFETLFNYSYGSGWLESSLRGGFDVLCLPLTSLKVFVEVDSVTEQDGSPITSSVH